MNDPEQLPGGERRRRRDPVIDLATAFAAVEQLPALLASRDRVLAVVGEPGEGPEVVSTLRLVEAVESDVALAVRVLRAANHAEVSTPRSIASVARAVELLGAERVRELVLGHPSYDFFERSDRWDIVPERFRVHALASQRIAARLADVVGGEIDRDEVMTAALLHDVGKLVLLQIHPLFPAQPHGRELTPEEAAARERRELGVDHATVGGVLARRWGLPTHLCSVIDRHHAENARSEAALVRLADMLAHYLHDGRVAPTLMVRVARTLGLEPEELWGLLRDLPGLENGRQHQVEPCPLSDRELEVLHALKDGKLYKDIASRLGISTSTIRTHLHNAYTKLGARDRAQAVLIASERGWI